MKTKRFVPLPVLLTIISLLIIVSSTTHVVRAKNPAPKYHLEDVSYELIAEMISRRHNVQANSHTRPPLVLVHGWRGLDENAPCIPNAPDPSDYPDDYWLHVDEDLVERGFDVTFAKLITGYGIDGSTPGCSPLAEDNVPHLMTAIDNALTANPGQDKVILIAHSMGGLVSRAYLESANYRDDVVELYTLGTPHLGVPITGVVTIIEFLTGGLVNLNEFCSSQPVASNTFSLLGVSDDFVQLASNSKTLTPDLVMVVEVEALVPGKVGVSADLLDSQGNVIATSNSIGSVGVGDNILELRFQGRDIFNSKRSGPYTLSNVRLIDYNVGGVVIETSNMVYTTGAYDVANFAASPTALPYEINPATPDISLQSHDSVHVCQVTASNNSGSNLSVADTFQADCQINLDSDGKYPEWMSYYYTIGPNDWPMGNQSGAPDNVGGWAVVESVTQILNNATGLAYWGLEYPNSSDLDLANRVLPDPGTFWGPWRPDTGTPHDFSITYAVPASRPRCPGSPFVGLSMDQSQNVTVTGVSVGDLIDHSINQTTVSFGGYVCPLPSVNLGTTVSRDDTCASSATVSVPEDHQDVTFCYTLTNDSLHVAVLDHTLTDALALSDPITQTLLLAPGASHTITASTTLSGTRGNCYDNEAEWRAVTATGFGQSQGNDANTPFMETTYQAISHASATVCVGQPVSIYLPLIVK